VRIDAGVVEGSQISRYYDPMIAKIITHGPTRDAAVEAMADALDSVVVEGIRHNAVFLAAVMAHPRWRNGALSTAFIAEEFPGTGTSPLSDAARRTIACAGVASAARDAQRRTGFGPHPAPQPTALSAVFGDDVRFDCAVSGAWDAWRVEIDGTPVDVVLEADRDGLWRGRVAGRAVVMGFVREATAMAFSWRGMRARMRAVRPRVADLMALMPRQSEADASRTVVCPMPGLVVSLTVGAGEKVVAGQTLAVIEAMKMENVIRAERDGTVKAVHVAEGASLAVDDVILELE